MKMNIGITDVNRKEMVQNLIPLLADTYLLYLKTQNFHWNVTGENFHSLHEMFEEQYEELAAATDEIAERVRALGFPVPASFAQFSKLSTLKEEAAVLSAPEMIKQLAADHESISRVLRKMNDAAEKINDPGTADLIAVRLRAHEKTAWMLRSSV